MIRFIDYLNEVFADLTEAFAKVSPDGFVSARNQSKRKTFLSQSGPDELRKHELFLDHGRKAGYAMDRDKDLQNVFNNGNVRGLGKKAIVHAIKSGARTLDAFDGHLPSLYKKHGFVATGRMKFSDEHAPADWNYKKHGRPDVVFMAYRGGHRDTIDQRVGKFSAYHRSQGEYHSSYEEAKRTQHAEAARSDGLEKRMPIRENENMEPKLKLSQVKDRLPEAGKQWIDGVSSQERHGLETILNNVGIDNFVEYWKEHRDDLQDIRNF